jgi:hypothetical protein
MAIKHYGQNITRDNKFIEQTETAVSIYANGCGPLLMKIVRPGSSSRGLFMKGGSNGNLVEPSNALNNCMVRRDIVNRGENRHILKALCVALIFLLYFRF